MTTVRIDVDSHRGNASVEASYPSLIGGGESENIEELLALLTQRVRAIYGIEPKETE